MGKVLIVEDDNNLANLYRQILEREGFEVLLARDKEGGLRTALNDDVSFMLLDYMLAGGTNGMELLEELQKNEKTKNISVVMLTNLVKDEEREKALKLGAKDYLPKAKLSPVNVVEFVKKYLS